MQEKLPVLDTNLFIRYFTNDTPEQASRVQYLLKKARANQYELPDVAIAEIVWVLLSFYKLSKEEVIEKLEGIISLEALKLNRQVIQRSIQLYRRYSISYIDAYLASYSIQNKSNKIYSFDNDLGKVSEIIRVKP